MYYSNKPLGQPPAPPILMSGPMSPCSSACTLFCGNLHDTLEEKHLMSLFKSFRVVECSKNWPHFGFVKFQTEDEACQAYVKYNGKSVMGRALRLEFQNKAKRKAMLHSMRISQSIEFINSRIQKEYNVPHRKVNNTNNSGVFNENTLTETLLSSLITSLLTVTSTTGTSGDDNKPVAKNEPSPPPPPATTTIETTTSEACGYSSDSGCRSTSSLGGCGAGNTDCSNTDYESDTSDDASDIHTGDSDCLNDLKTLHSSLDRLINLKQTVFWYVDGKQRQINRKKLEPGVYCSVNETSSLYSEPLDVLVKVADDQINEYVLFPA